MTHAPIDERSGEAVNSAVHPQVRREADYLPCTRGAGRLSREEPHPVPDPHDLGRCPQILDT
jgi:hypothetical protein